MRSFLICTFLLYLFSANAQTSKPLRIDTLEKKLNNTNDVIIKVKILSQLSDYYQTADPKLARKYEDMGLTQLVTGTTIPAIYVNGTFRTVTASSSGTLPGAADSLEDLKQLIFYNHALTVLNVKADAANQYFNIADVTWTGQYRFNVPYPGEGPTTINDTTSDENTVVSVFPAHVLNTAYNYNSTNQVTQQYSPDGGTNRYWYDLLSRLTISQNSKQLPLHNYSYTTYDTIGRITEVGQKNQAAINLGTPHYLTNDTLKLFYAEGIDSQVTRTYYDAPVPVAGGHSNGIATVTQNNLRKRVSASTYSTVQKGPAINATYYSYDLDGNVQTLWQQVNGMYVPASNANLKRVDYEYDLVSGKVNFVRYQDNQPDMFYYSYSYDADNRLTEAWSGTRALSDTLTHSVLIPGNGKRDAKYYYYLHSPLARMELGDTTARVQGTDYAYTLQGWLKGVNDSRVNSARDMGRDSLHVARDAYGYSLYYYANAIPGGLYTDQREQPFRNDAGNAEHLYAAVQRQYCGDEHQYSPADRSVALLYL